MNLQDELSTALHGVRLGNARLLNRMRAAGLSLFILTFLLMSEVWGDRDWRPGLLEWVYLGAALGLLVAGELFPRVLEIFRFAVPVFDMPLVFAIQLDNLDAASSLRESLADVLRGVSPVSPEGMSGQVAEFSVAIFICLLLLSALTLSARQVYLSLAVATGLQQVLHWQAGLTMGSHLTSLILFGLATWISAFAGRDRVRLIGAIAGAEARRERLRRYFSPQVADLLELQPSEGLGEGREVELTVLFVDLREFTRMSEALPGPEVVGLLNDCHTFLVDAIFRHGGTLDKYLRDGLMAYFNAPLSQEDHAERALRCALEMRAGLRVLNQSREAGGKAPLRLGIGIHTGPCVVGDIGAPHRREFTAIGQTVNLASRIESATKEAGVEILFSEATASRLDRGPAASLVGPFEIRGSSRPLTLFTIE